MSYNNKEIFIKPCVLELIINKILLIKKPKNIFLDNYEQLRSNILLDLNNFLIKKNEDLRLFIKSSMSKRKSVGFNNNIYLREVLKISKFLFSPPHKFTGSYYYLPESYYKIYGDITKYTRNIVMNILFEVIGSHHWGMNYIITSSIYPNDTNAGTIDKMYFNEIKKKLFKVLSFCL